MEIATDPPPLGTRPAAAPGSRRVTWADAARGYGIILVVFGHTLRGLVGGGLMAWTPATRGVDAWVYAFHMPLFFVLSGMFLPRLAARPIGTFAGDKLRTIAYPYLVWSTLTLLIKSSLGRSANDPRTIADLPLIFHDPIDQFWFLYVLFFLAMAAGVLLKLRAGPLGLLAAAVLAYPGVLPSSGGWVPLIEARLFAIYLAAGAVFGAGRWPREVAGARRPWLAATACVGLAIPALAVAAGLEGRTWLRPALALAGTAAVVALAILTGRTRLDRAIRLLGVYSLPIFVAHTIASAGTRIALVKFARIGDPATHLVLGTVAGLLVPLGLAIACERIGFPYGFTLPKRADRRAEAVVKPGSRGVDEIHHGPGPPEG